MARSCYNKEYGAGYWTSERKITVTGDDAVVEIVPKWIPHVMTADCRYDKMQLDPECKGCKWNKNS